MYEGPEVGKYERHRNDRIHSSQRMRRIFTVQEVSGNKAKDGYDSRKMNYSELESLSTSEEEQLFHKN
jgi:hypothetical protein